MLRLLSEKNKQTKTKTKTKNKTKQKTIVEEIFKKKIKQALNFIPQNHFDISIGNKLVRSQACMHVYRIRSKNKLFINRQQRHKRKLINCDPSQQNRAVVFYQEKCDVPFIWKSILLTQGWYHSCVNWMQHWNLWSKKVFFSFYFLCFSHTNGVISWNAFYRQLPCFNVMGHN